jgi:hypothetical protein
MGILWIKYLSFDAQLKPFFSFLVSQPGFIKVITPGIQTIGKLKSNIHETEFTLLVAEVFVHARRSSIPAFSILQSG